MRIKNVTPLIFLFAIMVIQGNAQTTIWSETFDAGSPKVVLNTNDVSCNPTPICAWIINNAYTGGTGGPYTICPGGTVNYNSHNTPNRAGNNYLHIHDTSAAKNAGIKNATWLVSDGICSPVINTFAKTTAINTAAYATVTLKFWWVCHGGSSLLGGAAVAYGRVYYSIDGGTVWTQITTPIQDYINVDAWTQQTISLPQFANQNDLRFGFMWVNGNNLFGSYLDPPFCIDDISIEVPGTTVNSVTTGALAGSSFCSDSKVNVPFSTAGTYNSGNVFTVELSNASGSFTSGTSNIGTGSTSPILVSFPVGTSGTQYRMRVKASNPPTTGSDNGTDITIKPAPVANFTQGATTGMTVTFNNQSTGGTDYTWNFDDNGATSTSPNPTYTFVNPGEHHVCIDVTNQTGCHVGICADITVFPLGINAISAAGIWKIYPSPFGENIFISAGKSGIKEIESVGVYDLLGRKLIDETVRTQENPLVINTERLNEGVYLLKIKAGGVDYFQTVTKL